MMVSSAYIPAGMLVFAAQALSAAGFLELHAFVCGRSSDFSQRWQLRREDFPVAAFAIAAAGAMVWAASRGADLALSVLGALPALTSIVATMTTLYREERRRNQTMAWSLLMLAYCLHATVWCTFAALGAPTSYSRPHALELPLVMGQWIAMFVSPIAALASLSGCALLAIERRAADQTARARVDPLTAVLHRGALEEEALRLANEHARAGRTMACLVIDIDHFKHVNDNAGHRSGDAVLRAVSRVLSGSVRSTDILGRYGGEEFCALLPDTTLKEASSIAERARAAVALLRLPAPLRGSISVSIGVSAIAMHGDERRCWSALFDAADRALYMAKNTGRNCVACDNSQMMSGQIELGAAA
ncbi:GGDEF domain-containing protein [Cupriavidus plantarum]|uniref:GGDEF domain-containing protein n=3 Tax=Cupriavidus plantarum TaxID=942865 RepID=UPI00339D82CB